MNRRRFLTATGVTAAAALAAGATQVDWGRLMSAAQENPSIPARGCWWSSPSTAATTASTPSSRRPIPPTGPLARNSPTGRKRSWTSAKGWG
nr:twin-arginine translocation signal domain-containing protein [Amycolatopsis sp. Hca4]